MGATMRLFRPHIPLEVRCRVALRQLGEMWPDRLIDENAGALGKLLAFKLVMLGCLLQCEVKDLRLDHDPPLGARAKRGTGKNTRYTPAANDHEHLFYRPHGTQFAGSHDVKTRIRGDHGQYSDVVLIKRERRRKKKASASSKRKSRFSANKSKMKSANRWPPRGARKMNWRKR